MSTNTLRTLGSVVRAALNSRGADYTQKWLSQQLGTTEAELSKKLNARQVMGDDEVLRVSEILGLSLREMLLLGAIARCEARAGAARREVNKSKKVNDSKARTCAETERRYYQKAGKIYRELVGIIGKVAMRPVTATREHISLEDFPDLVPGSWTVLVGDRRESPPKGLGDLIGLSVASSDFMFLHRLALPSDTTIMRSDKTMVIASESSLSELLKNNLLIIGSPAVSLSTRAVLRDVGATFMFNIGNEAYDRERRLYERVGGPSPREVLEKFVSLKDVAEELDDLLATFRKNGFVDPIDFKGIRGRAIDKDQDYGMVSLTHNPWSEKHIACICAGVHGGGTAGAVQLLASPKEFSEHPWGGVFKVSVSDQVPWEKRFENLAPRWETHVYDPGKYLAHIDDLISRVSAPARGGSRNHEIRQVELDIAMLRRVREFAKSLIKGDKQAITSTSTTI